MFYVFFMILLHYFLSVVLVITILCQHFPNVEIEVITLPNISSIKVTRERVKYTTHYDRRITIDFASI